MDHGQDIVKSRPLLQPIRLQEIKKYQQACTNKKINTLTCNNLPDPENGNDYEKAKSKLTAYFAPKKNVVS